jgi:hypothetical protein
VTLRTISRWLLVAQLLMATLHAGSAGAVTPTSVAKISRVTGATPAGETLPNPNQTATNYAVYGTDLGIMWDKGGGEIFVLFGDTFGASWCGNGGCGGDWRSNVLARSSDTFLANGLSFSTMIQDAARHAKEILPSQKVDFSEITVIPTAGVTVGARHYIHYMSVNHWGEAGMWFTNYSGIAYSDDNGQSWIKHPTARWQNNSTWTNNFQMAAFLKNGGFVYMYATPNGRLGNVYLARVPESALLNINAYQYWDGNGWSTSQAAASPVVIGIAGELSVAYNSYFQRFIMTYLNEHRQAVVMRDSATLTGPWSGEKVLARAASFPGLYNAFIHPWTNAGTELYFIMSQWTPYNTFLMRATLASDAFGSNLLSEPGFETQEATPVMAPWYVEGNGGIDRNLGSARTGQDNGFVRYNSGWNALKQRVVVQPHTDYTLKGWVRTSANNTAGYLGARVPNNGPILGEIPFGALGPYTELSVSFNSGPRSVVEIYSGLWADGDTWLQLDDVSLTRGPNLVGHAGFEEQPSASATSPWYVQGSAGIDRGLGFARTGLNNAWARNSSGWNAIKQEVAVAPNTNYTLTGWIRTSANHADGYFGARLLNGGPILSEYRFNQPLANYTRLTVQFNSGSNHSVEVFAGLWALNGDSWIQVDDISLTQN